MSPARIWFQNRRLCAFNKNTMFLYFKQFSRPDGLCRRQFEYCWYSKILSRGNTVELSGRLKTLLLYIVLLPTTYDHFLMSTIWCTKLHFGMHFCTELTDTGLCKSGSLLLKRKSHRFPFFPSRVKERKMTCCMVNASQPKGCCFN